MESKTRIVWIVINDKEEILLQQWHGYEELRTPGGKVDEGESDIECLERELQEEMHAKLLSAEWFGEFSGKSFYSDHIIVNRVYIAQISGDLHPGEEVERLVRVSKKEYILKIHKMIPSNEEIFDQLIERGIW